MTTEAWNAHLAKMAGTGSLRLAAAASTVHDLLLTSQLAVTSRGLDPEVYLSQVFGALFDLYMSRADAARDDEGEEAYDELPPLAVEESA